MGTGLLSSREENPAKVISKTYPNVIAWQSRDCARRSSVFCLPNHLMRTTIISSAARLNHPLLQLVMTNPVWLSYSKRVLQSTYTKILFSFPFDKGFSIILLSPYSPHRCSPSVPDIFGVYEWVCNGRIDLSTPCLGCSCGPFTESWLQTFIHFSPWVKTMGFKTVAKTWASSEGRGHKMSSLKFITALLGGFMAPAVLLVLLSCRGH